MPRYKVSTLYLYSGVNTEKKDVLKLLHSEIRNRAPYLGIKCENSIIPLVLQLVLKIPQVCKHTTVRGTSVYVPLINLLSLVK